ncbi:MAG: glycogen synthase [Elusimicrobiota bacterium]
MKILMTTSECVPYIKTGGMADVVGSLAAELAKQGHEVITVLPKYRLLNTSRHSIKPFLSPMKVHMGSGIEEFCAVHKAPGPENLRTYFIEHNNFFDRDGIYHDSNFNDYQDNALRYAFLSNAALVLCKEINFKPDIIHAHDWQGAPALAFLNIWYRQDPILGQAAGILTIHNMAHQGVYGGRYYDYTGFGWNNFTPDKFEDHGRINYLKGGIHYADIVNTVSPQYAWETVNAGSGCGLEYYLRKKGDRYTGILNGADYSSWDPATDTLISANYSPDNLSGKNKCKKELARQLNLDLKKDRPIVGLICRFVHQKGMDLLAASIEKIVQNMEVSFAILGAGDKGLEYYYIDLPSRYPGRVGSYIGYSEELAHTIEAGSDFFLMPSRYEPCGLNQMYSLKYGTLPIVNSTGGLADTVEQYEEKNGTGTGFKFFEATPHAVYYSVGWAVSTYYDRPEHMKKLIKTAMGKDFSWKRSAQRYLQEYDRAIQISKKREF